MTDSDEKSAEKILVILNPANCEVSFACDLELKECIYSMGGEIKKESGMVQIPPRFAGFYLI
jgi:hypothetical protein